MNCPSCGHALKPGARFCNTCGATITDSLVDGPSSAGDRTIAVTPQSGMPNQGYAPPANQGYAPPMNQGYMPPAPQGYGPAQQAGYPQQPAPYAPQAPAGYQQSGYPQPAPYAPQPPVGYQQPYGQAPAYGAPYAGGYAVQSAPAIPLSNGRTPALLMLLSTLMMVAATFVTFLIIDGESFSILDIMSKASEAGPLEEDARWGIGFMLSLPVMSGLSVLTSSLALFKRTQVWGGLSLLLSMCMLALSGILLLGATIAAQEPDAELLGGAALPMYFWSSVVFFVCSIVYLARKKVKR